MLKTDGLPELSQLDVFKSPCFVFDIHSREKKDLITRYHGTVCRKLPAGFEIVSWQKSIDAHLSVSVNGRSVSESDIKADDFPGCYSRLNRAYTRAYHAEKKFFAAGGKQRFSNMPSLVGLMVLALSHEGMSGTFSHAAKLENILIFLQTGEGRKGCIGFRKGLNMNQQYMLKAAIGAALGCAALALGIALKRRVRL